MSPSDITAFSATPTQVRRHGSRVLKLSYDQGGRELFIVALCLALFGALRVGGLVSESIHATTPGPMMACLTLPMAAVIAVFWGLGRLFSNVSDLR